MEREPAHANAESGKGYESQDKSVRYLVWCGIGVAVFLIAGHLAAAVMFYVSSQRSAPRTKAPPVLSQPVELASGPQLQAYPTQDLATVREAEARDLAAYGWIDRNAGVVRIPVERAMDILIRRGLPTRPQTQPAGAAAQPQGGPSR